MELPVVGARGFVSFVTRSTVFSIDEFINSAVKTKPIAKITAIHSKVLIANRKPATITAKAKKA